MKVIFNTIHPAPYIDRLTDYLIYKGIDVECWYFYAITAEKAWKNYKAQNIHLYNDVSLFKRIYLFSKADLIIFAWGSINNYIMAFILYLLRVKFVFYMDHPDFETSKTKGVVGCIKRLMLNLSTAVFPASYSCADYISKIYNIRRDKIYLFPYTHSKPSSQVEEYNNNRKKALASGDKPCLLIASRFIERKGYSIVLKAFKELKNLNILDSFDIVILGNGEKYEYYKKELMSLSKQIKFMGWVENDDYENILLNCDIYLHPSLFEPFGIPPLDAMVRNKFLIVSDGVKSTDIFKKISCKGVWVYQSFDAKELSRLLVKILQNKDSIYNYAEHNYELCEKYYSIDINYQSIIAVCKSI